MSLKKLIFRIKPQTQKIFTNIMKIQLSSTLPFTPVQLDTHQAEPRRTVGQLHGVEDGLEYRMPVYEFRHGDDDAVQYQVIPSERIFVKAAHALSVNAANDGTADATQGRVWIEHDDSLTYKPYAFLVMNAMTKLVGAWDGVVYRTPSGERLRESAFQATLQVVDACVCPGGGLWMMVSLAGDNTAGLALDNPAVRQLGWVPVAC